MKTPSSNRFRRPSGFTLIELLVVIAIIAVLAAVGFTAGTKAINSARAMTAKTTATSIDLALNNYFEQYTSFPDVGTQVSTDSPDGIRLVNILAGLNDGDENPKKIKFLTLKEGKGNRDGATFAADGKITNVADAWGNPYVIFIDQDYEEKVSVKLGGSTKVLNGRKVASATAGGDKELGTKDDVKTW